MLNDLAIGVNVIEAGICVVLSSGCEHADLIEFAQEIHSHVQIRSKFNRHFQRVTWRSLHVSRPRSIRLQCEHKVSIIVFLLLFVLQKFSLEHSLVHIQNQDLLIAWIFSEVDVLAFECLNFRHVQPVANI